MRNANQQIVELEEYKLLVTTISHIFWEFWTGNAFFMSFFSGITVGLILAVTGSESDPLPLLVRAGILIGIVMMSAVWMMSNLKHFYFTALHINHAKELEARLGSSIFTRRTAQATGLARFSVRKIWSAVPVLFLLFDSTLVLWA